MNKTDADPSDDHEHAHAVQSSTHDDGHHHDHDDHDDHAGRGFLTPLRRLGFLQGHSHAPSLDSALEGSDRGIWAVKVSLVLLALTGIFQVIVVIFSGSVALLADTIHNFTDASTALPLWLAFSLSRRPASRRYTFGLGRVEDLAGALVVLLILLSGVVAGYESYRKLLDPQPLSHVEWVMVAAIVGFAGNELVASFRIRIGREIGSAALVADGQHARVDGLTSLAVLVGALGTVLGAPIADPIVGVVITVAILFITKDAALLIWQRLTDAVEPELMQQLEDTADEVMAVEPGARGIDDVRLRWLGHSLQAEMSLRVDDELSTRESHRIAEELRHALFHAMPRLGSVTIHVDPWSAATGGHHEVTDHHRS